MSPERVYPTSEGIAAAIGALKPIRMARTAATTGLPVLLALQHELAAGRGETVSIEDDDFEIVANSAIRGLVDRWFGVEEADGDAPAPYFVPMPLPGAASAHWRDKGLVAQSVFTSLVRRGWVRGAVDLEEGQGKGYPLQLPANWRIELAQDIRGADAKRDGIDLAALGTWLARRVGVDAAQSPPTRDELISFATQELGLSATDDLVAAPTAAFTAVGDYEAEEAHFSASPLSAADLLAALKAAESSADATSRPPNVPEELWEAWLAENWRPIRDQTGQRREAGLPELLTMLERFLRGETGLAEFAKESQDLSFSEPHWGFKGFGQMQLNQYSKVATATQRVSEVERVLRASLRVPTSEDAAAEALRELVTLTQTLANEAAHQGIGKPAPGRVPLVVSYFWEAQERNEWPIAYRASKEVLRHHGLLGQATDPTAEYLEFRSAILALAKDLGGDIWDVEALLWTLRPHDTSGGDGDGLNEPRVWLIRAGERGAHESLALGEGVAVIGWSQLGELHDELSRDELKEMIRATYGEERAASRASQAGQIHRFINDVAVDDLVVLPRLADRGHVAIGRVMGDYEYRADGAFASTDARNTRPVDWLAEAIPYDRFDADLREAFAQQGTISEIDKPDAAERLLAAVEGTDASAIHLVLKWSPSIDASTIDRHREVVDRHGAVWWGRLGKEGTTGLAGQWVEKLQQQLEQGSTTYVFLHSPRATWRSQLIGVQTSEPEESELVPEYYDPEAHHTLWVKLAGFEQIAVTELTEQYVLARSGGPVTQGGLGNQTPLIVRRKGAVTASGDGGRPRGDVAQPFNSDAVRLAAEARGLILSAQTYHQIVAALESGKHVVFTGPPGTAKTTLAEAVATAAKSAGRAAGYVLTTATADWTTFETIGGLRPTSSGELQFEEGHFLAAIRSEKWLVIDELNRSNFDRAFGQLFTVLSGQAVVLPYQRPGVEPPRPLALVPDGADFAIEDFDVLTIPEPWRVIATMNVFDKTLLFEMSFALMRRFAFIEVPSPSDEVFDALIEKETAGATEAAELSKQLLVVRKIKDLGPAVFMDLARFVRERLSLEPGAGSGQVLFEAFYAYLLPQFEGIDDVTGESLFKEVGKVVGAAHHERLRRTLNAVLGLELQPKQQPVLDEEEVEEPEQAE